MRSAEALHRRLTDLMTEVRTDQSRISAAWSGWSPRAEFRDSSDNLAAYLALRHRDLRDLQRELMPHGLSSLGRIESRVLPALSAVGNALAGIADLPHACPCATPDFFAGEQRLADRSAELFGMPPSGHAVAVMLTCPSEAADDAWFMDQVAAHRVQAVRINCAHDDADRWARMIEHARAAQQRTGHRIRVFMDLAGPRIRTRAVRCTTRNQRVGVGDRIVIVAPGVAERLLVEANVTTVECTLPEVLNSTEVGHRLFIDDGKIAAVIERREDGAVFARVQRCKEAGAKLKPGKGINFPDSDLDVPALTAQDRDDLRFVARHADAIDYSFVQSADDVGLLQDALAELRPDDWHRQALVLKIETARAIANLPDMLVCAGARQPVAIMIARGDLAIEIGFGRLAEMQEEILWIAEAAHTPVIWATQVLEHLVREGMPTRGELTDAAMAARAECVMLNKGPFVFEAVAELHRLIERMDGHLFKKTPQLRRLASW